MNLNNITAVKIDSVGGHKFIVASVSDGAHKQIVIRANKECDFHRDILKILRFEVTGSDTVCIGGGQIRVNPNEKTINIWGRSGDFGLEPDRNLTARMLKDAFPDFNVIIGSTW